MEKTKDTSSKIINYNIKYLTRLLRDYEDRENLILKFRHQEKELIKKEIAELQNYAVEGLTNKINPLTALAEIKLTSRYLSIGISNEGKFPKYLNPLLPLESLIKDNLFMMQTCIANITKALEKLCEEKLCEKDNNLQGPAA